MAVPDDVFQTHPPMDYDALRDQVRTGDLLLCSGRAFFSRAIQWATGSRWSHVAVIVRLEPIDRIVVLEAVESAGVRARTLSSFFHGSATGLPAYRGDLLVARHLDFEDAAAPERLKELSQFALDRFGCRYDGREVFRILLRIVMGRFRANSPAVPVGQAMICSEYAYVCFERLGLQVPWDRRGFIAPADFARDPRIVPVATVLTRPLPRADA
jgi:hypothetical protein